MLKSLKKARKSLEVLLVRLGVAVLPFWPRRLILACARLAGIIGYYCARGQRRLTMANMEIAFGQRKSLPEKRRIAIHAFQIMALVFLDYFWFIRRPHERVRKYVNMDLSVSAYIPPPAVLITAHFGNWELMSRAFTAAGHPHVAVAASLSNPAVDVMLNKFRADGDAEVIPMQGAVRGLLRALRRKQYIALLLDQNTKPGDGGLFVDFFGLPVPISTSAAILAERANVPITPFFCLAQRNGKYLIYALPPIKAADSPAGEPDSVRYLTQKIAAVFQEEIEKHPEQWMWMYKRWKHIKPGWPAKAYPYYAKSLH